MSVVFILLPLALLFVGIAITWFVWAVRSGQFDDLETPAVRILFDDEPTAGPSQESGTVSDTSSREVEIR
jgi:cbb3-type cytochrome oxidase maturation protein